MSAMRGLFAKLHLRVNDAKSAVAPPWERKFLGYSFWVSKDHQIRRMVASKALETMKQRVRALTGRSCGRSMETVVAKLRGYLLGWKEYFHLAETPSTFRHLDSWIRHRLRAIQLKHWRNGPTIFREVRKRGFSPLLAQVVAANARSWWRNAGLDMSKVLPPSYFDGLGLPRLTQ
jgi:RNA-directed DNA polymerase